MDEKAFVWTTELTKKLLELRFQNNWLFKKKKQPWMEFRTILLENGYPETMTVNHVRKKWSYTYDCYKIAKKTKNKSWRYYKMFEKHFGKSSVLDKYESWNDKWRLKLVICITETKDMKVDYQHFWRNVEKAMRSQELPADCCIQDMKGLWQHIITTFNRKYRQKLRKDVDPGWPLFEAMMSYYQRFDPEYLVRLETETPMEFFSRHRKASDKYGKSKDGARDCEADEFQWSKDITETFIQIRLQNDRLFRERKWAWNDLLNIMKQEYGFPDTLSGREICRKWAATFAEYQKAKATNNKSWIYYSLFELYLGEERLSLNPLVGWQEEWVLNLINARTELDYLFKYTKYRDQTFAWREVEKKLRIMCIPDDHSLLDLSDIWTHLLKTFKWKRKFANKGILNEHWAYYDAMARSEEVRIKPKIKEQTKDLDQESYDHADHGDDDFEDDIKLLDLKQRMQPKVEPPEKRCRSCCGEAACVELYGSPDAEGVELADKLSAVGGIQMDKSDKLPSQICLSCLNDLEHAYKFRRKCQDVDKHLRATNTIKIEVPADNEDIEIEISKDNDIGDMDTHFDGDFEDTDMKQEKQPKQENTLVRKKKKMRKLRYDYWKVCEICGKHTRNLNSHLDMHSSGKCYSCDVCDKKFKFKSGLVIHKAVHDPTPKKTCEVCGKTFHILAQYRRHFVHHANERNHECDTCGKRFNTSEILTVHKRTHTDERPFSCTECWKTFRTAGCVSRHKRIVHRKVKNQ